MHFIQTIRMLNSVIGVIDFICFDLIMVGDLVPVILCSERATNEILYERLKYLGAIFLIF